MTPLEKYTRSKREKFQAYIEKRIDRIPSWIWSWISRVHLIDVPFIKKWASKPWNKYQLTMNLAITREEKFKHPEIFRLEYLIENFEELEKFPQVRQSIYFADLFSRNDKNIVADVERYPDFEWNWLCISLNTNITEDFVIRYIALLDLEVLASNKALSLSFLERTYHIVEWPIEGIAKNPNLTEDALFKFFSKAQLRRRSVMYSLSENEGISVNFILSRPDLDWNREVVSYRNITKEHILKYPDFPWDWNIISGCSSIDKNFLRSHPKTNMTVFYRYHSGLTIDEVEHLEPEDISANILCGAVEDKADFLRHYYACKTIGDAFFKCYWDYTYAYCKRRLNKRYDQLFGIE